MRTVKNTPDQLILHHRRSLGVVLGWGAFIFITWPIMFAEDRSLIGTLVSLALALAICTPIFHFLAPAYRTIFDRQSETVELVESRMFKTKRVSHGLREITKPVVQNRVGNLFGRDRGGLALLILRGGSAGTHVISNGQFWRVDRYEAQISNWLKAYRTDRDA